MQKIIQFLFLILVCTATLAGRPIFDMDELFIIFTGLIAFLGLTLRSNTERRLRIIDILFLMAIVFGLANERVFNVDLTIKYLSMAGVWFFVKESDSPRFERGLLQVVVLAALVHAFVAFLQSFGVLSNYNYFFKTTGLFFNPGPFGCYVSFALAALLTWVLFDFKSFTKWQEAASVIAVMLLVYGLILSDSRAAYFAVIVMIMVCLFLKFRSRIRLKKIHVGALLLLLSGALIVLYMYRPSSANARMGIWKITVQAVGQKPILGYGTDSFQRTYMFKQADYLTDADEEMRRNADEVKTAFNVPLELLYEQGIIGLLIWGSIVFLSFKGMFESSDDMKKQLVYPVITFLVFSLFSYPHQIWGLTCPFIALLSLGGGSTCMRVHGKADRRVSLGIEITLLSVLLLLFVSRVLIDRNLLRYSRFEMEYREVESHQYLNKIMYRSPGQLFFYADNQMLTNDYVPVITTITQYKKYRNSYTFERNLAYSYEITGDTVNALEHYEVAHSMCPGYLEPVFSKFLIYENRNDAQAVPLARDIMNYSPKLTNSRTMAMKHRVSEFLETIDAN